MTVVTTIDVYGMPPEEYRAILDHMGVETRPAAGLFLHLTSKTDFGFRVVEIWDRKEGSGGTGAGYRAQNGHCGHTSTQLLRTAAAGAAGFDRIAAGSAPAFGLMQVISGAQRDHESFIHRRFLVSPSRVS
jgi:hypothetical protein